MVRRALILAAALSLLGAASAPAASLVTVAGTGEAGSTGDGGPASAATLNHPYAIAAMPDGGYVVAEVQGDRVRRVAPDGTITTLAGGIQGSGGDGGPAISAQLRSPFGVSVAGDGSVLIADFGNQRIRRVAPDGTISTMAGNGNAGFAGDGGPATEAALAWPTAVAALPGGGFLIADWFNERIRRVDPDGTITTVAGTGATGFAGDGGPATLAQLNQPFGVAAMPDGGFLIADHANDRIRRVGPDGIITTVAGTGVRGFAGDGGPALGAALNHPTAMTPDGAGGFLIADRTNQRIRDVAASGTITSVAGSGVPAWLDAGDATLGHLRNPSGVAVSGDSILIADSDNNRIRKVGPGPGPSGPPTVLPAVRAEVQRVGPLAVQDGQPVWSRYNAASRRFALVIGAGDAVRRLPVGTRKVPFDVDAGRSRGRALAVYSRCRRDPVTARGRMGMPVWATGRGCRLYAYDFARKRERRLRVPGNRGASVFLPSVAGNRIAFGRREGSGRPTVVLRQLDGHGKAVRWSGPRGRQAGPTGLDLSSRALAIGWATTTKGGRAAAEVWLRAGRRLRRLTFAKAGSGLILTAPVLDGAWVLWGQSCARGENCTAPRVRRAAVRGGGGPSREAPGLALAAIAARHGRVLALGGVSAQALAGCGGAAPGATCRVLDLGRPFS
jgi:sugar lactone lactonase YvrE